MNGQISIIAT